MTAEQKREETYRLYHSGMKIAQIAKVLGINQSSVRDRLRTYRRHHPRQGFTWT